MITKNTGSAYDILFSKAEERLADQGIKDADGNAITIESLEEYFEHLKDLVYGNDELPEEAALLFLKLPLDEPHFKIDANTRKIEIPKHFMDNGLSVQGDEVAEIVFFEIDRYYDATDLYETNIAIEWEIGSGNTKVAGYTPAFIKTTHDFVTPDNKDKVIFGWPITSEITAQAGKMTFSVRFYNEYANNDNYDYSFRTLPATININQGLAVDPLKVEADDASELILRRIVNSRPDGSYGEATVPWIVFSNWPNEYEFAAITEDTYLAVLANGGSRSGTLSYAWYCDGEYLDSTNPWQSLNENNTYLSITNYVDGVNSYYKKVDNDYELIVIMDADSFATELAAAKTLYIKVAYYLLTKDNAMAGTYTVDVQNRFYTTEAYASQNSTESGKQPPIWIITGPDKLTVITNLTDYFTINGTELAVDLDGDGAETTYQWKYSLNNTEYTDISGANSITYIPENEGYYYLHAENTRNQKKELFDSVKCLAIKEIPNFEVKLTLNDLGTILTASSITSGRDLTQPQAFENTEIIWRVRTWGGEWVTIDGGLELDITGYLGASDDVQFEFTYNITKGNLTNSALADYTLKATQS